MSVQSHLTDTASRAVLTATETSSIGTSITTLNARLSDHFGSNIRSQFQFGSSTRGTILPRSIDEKSDIDYMIVFTESGYKPQTYIDRLKKFAETKYGSSEIKQSSPTVVLSLNHISFDLVPALSQWNGYQIPAPSSGYVDWIDTDPNGFNQTLTSANQLHNYHIKPMVRLVKYWNARNGYVFNSYSLEQHLVQNTSWQSSFKEYVYNGFLGLQTRWDAAQSQKDKVARAHKIIRDTKRHEAEAKPIAAESEIKKLLPVI